MLRICKLSTLLKFLTAVVLLSFSLVNFSFAAMASSGRFVDIVKPLVKVFQAIRNPLTYFIEDTRWMLEKRSIPEDLDASDPDEFLQYIGDQQLRGTVGHVVQVRLFLKTSEPILSPDLSPKEFKRRERDLILGFLVIWLSENPKNMLFQGGEGPAVGILQIEPITAMDHLKRALYKSSKDAQRVLTQKILKDIQPDGDLAREISKFDFSKSHEIRMRDLLIQYPVLQFLVWRLFLDNRVTQIPQTREAWSQFHANDWNTAYWCDLEQTNASRDGVLCRNPHLGLAIPHKTSMMSNLIGQWMLTPMSVSVVKEQRELSRSMRFKMRDTGRILGVYEHLTRALREVRNTELALNALEKKEMRSEELKKIDEYQNKLKRLIQKKGHLYMARQETDRLVLYYKPRGLSQAMWDSELEELNHAIGTIEAGVHRLQKVMNYYPR